MKRKEFLILAALGLGGVVVACGSNNQFNLPFSSSSLPSSVNIGDSSRPGQSTESASASIPVFAHYMDWAVANEDCWGPAASRPLLRPSGYASNDPAVIAAHNTEMTANGILPMISWWARDTYAGDEFLDLYLSMPGPQIGILYEALGPGRLKTSGESINMDDPENAGTFISDMEHLQEKYFSRYPDRFYRIAGRPVVFIWISNAFTGPFDQVVARARQNVSFYLVGSDFTSPFGIKPGHESVIRAMDAISTYGGFDIDRYGSEMNVQYVADYRKAVLQWTRWLASNSPHTKLLLPMCFSYDDRKIPGRRQLHFTSSPEIALQFAQLVRTLITNPCEPERVLPLAFTTSYNEHFEGSAVEPSDLYGDRYLRIINKTFNVPQQEEKQRANCSPD